MSRIQALVSDFGGVLTSPLLESFTALQERSGVGLEDIGRAMARVAQSSGANPLYELETGRLTLADFLGGLSAALREETGRDVSLDGFGDAYFAELHPNEELLAFLRSLRDTRGLRLALLTNNVREWEPLWRAKLPVDELFELVVDSAFVGMRKPDPEIYELTLSRLGLPAQACLFLDDLDVNVTAARDLGLHAIHFRSNAQAIPEIRAALR
ncbi:MAG: putative hydrolase of the superfamily [Solirubrobacteraceae bacterium]|nr:putative hydrolase of the superfamily [Solirubrobacteraceae bacterium]